MSRPYGNVEEGYEKITYEVVYNPQNQTGCILESIKAAVNNSTQRIDWNYIETVIEATYRSFNSIYLSCLLLQVNVVIVDVTNKQLCS